MISLILTLLLTYFGLMFAAFVISVAFGMVGKSAGLGFDETMHATHNAIMFGGIMTLFSIFPIGAIYGGGSMEESLRVLLMVFIGASGLALVYLLWGGRGLSNDKPDSANSNKQNADNNIETTHLNKMGSITPGLTARIHQAKPDDIKALREEREKVSVYLQKLNTELMTLKKEIESLVSQLYSNPDLSFLALMSKSRGECASKLMSIPESEEFQDAFRRMSSRELNENAILTKLLVSDPGAFGETKSNNNALVEALAKKKDEYDALALKVAKIREKHARYKVWMEAPQSAGFGSAHSAHVATKSGVDYYLGDKNDVSVDVLGSVNRRIKERDEINDYFGSEAGKEVKGGLREKLAASINEDASERNRRNEKVINEFRKNFMDLYGSKILDFLSDDNIIKNIKEKKSKSGDLHPFVELVLMDFIQPSPITCRASLFNQEIEKSEKIKLRFMELLRQGFRVEVKDTERGSRTESHDRVVLVVHY